VSGEDEGGRLREGRKFVLSGFIYFAQKRGGQLILILFSWVRGSERRLPLEREKGYGF
jgi:hypothetical protein